LGRLKVRVSKAEPKIKNKLKLAKMLRLTDGPEQGRALQQELLA
jgi:hypothetical protein